MSQSGLRPLEGKRVLLTNPLEGSDSFRQQLIAWGAQTQQLPLIIVDSVSFALERTPDCFDWLFFTSKNGVNSFYTHALAQSGQWASLPVATVGPVTAQTVQQFGITPQYVAPRYEAGSAAQDFARHYANQNLRCLWPCGNLAGPTLKQRLEQAGMHVTPLVVYETRERSSLSPAEEKVLAQPYDLLIFTSPSAVRAYAAQLKQSPKTSQIACIGPRTARAARHLLGGCDIEASAYTLNGLAEAIERFFSAHTHIEEVFT